MKAFLLALQFLTCIPLRLRSAPETADWGRSALAYPAVGLIIGLLLVGLQTLLRGADPQLQAALLVAAWTLITGGLHLDGLADSADAWVGGHGDRQRTLDIMKDPRSGPAGVTAVVLALVLKFAALAALVKTPAWQALLLAPLLGRSALIGLMLATPCARPGGMAAMLAAHLPRRAGALMLLAVAAGVSFAGVSGLAALLAAAAGWVVLRRMMLRRLGGMTGDTLGASVELIEVAVLVVLALLG